jgi:GR25 family glycosyltransferase involved in LPS biosynthesis
MVSICLNMIVKNESHIIEETLTMLSKYIDYWVITDTGSSDNTIEIIKEFFQKINIPGELHEDKWEDFGTNRTKSLERSYNKCDYIWVFDADDLIVGEPEFPKIVIPNIDCYHVTFGKDFTYDRPQILKSDLKWVYKCVLHEYVCCLSKPEVYFRLLGGDYYINSRRLGSRSQDPKKYLNDAETLIRNIDKEPEHKLRYMYYIAQSYKDYGDLESAIEWYQKRVLEDGWIEEKFISAFELANCMVKLNKPNNDIILAYYNAHAILNERREPLFMLGMYFKEQVIASNDLEEQKKLLSQAYHYLYKSIQIPYSDKYKLFVQYDIYEWKNKYELAYVQYLLNNYIESTQLCEELVQVQNVRKNLNVLQMIEKLRYLNVNYNEIELTQYPENIINTIMDRLKIKDNSNKEDKITLTITTCKRYHLFEKTINSFLNCCKDIQLIDRWICIDDNSSQEDRENMKFQYPFFEFYYKTIEEKGHIISMNMIQDIVKSPYILHLEDDWLFIKKEYIIKPALYILESTHFHYIDTEAKDIIEKNNSQIAQVLFNINYTEDTDHVVLGGYMIETAKKPNIKCILHEHHKNTENSRLRYYSNCAYWPHYSFRPSLFKREIFDKLGRYNINGNDHFFERIYADKYFENNYLSCFYNKIICSHIGKKTYETNVDNANAYHLNNVSQFNNNNNNNNKNNNKIVDNNYLFLPNQDSFGNDIFHYGGQSIQDLFILSQTNEDCIAFNTYGYFKNKINDTFISLSNVYNQPDGIYINKTKLHQIVKCINLEHRTDRKEYMIKQFDALHLKYEIVPAVYGKELIPTPELCNLFNSNDLGCTLGVVGAALSHKNLWENLMNEKLKSYYIIFEDDTELHSKYDVYLKKIQEKINTMDTWDMIFVSYLNKDKGKDMFEKNDDVDIEFVPFDTSNYIGGFQNYIISKTGAEKLLNYIKENGIRHGIDYIIKILPSFEVYQLQNFISHSNWVNRLDNGVDSDIQYENNYLDIYSDDNFQYIRGMDIIGFDSRVMSTSTIDELKEVAMKNDNCVCFNSLGFLKYYYDFSKVVHSSYYKNISDGLYVKRKYLENANNKKTRIKVICNWITSDKVCELFNKMSKGNYIWNNIQITWEDTDIDFYVIINYPGYNEYYDPKRTIIFQMEPWGYDDNSFGVKSWGIWSNPDENVFLQVRNHIKYLNNAEWHLSMSYTELMRNPIIKNDAISTIISSVCSSKYIDKGHIKRIDFMKYIENKADPDVQLHIYGRDNIHQFNSYNGQINEKEDGIVPYRYYFMCENNSEYNYATEKLWDALLSETLIFYWGCPNVSDYINPLAFVELDMDDFDKSFHIIKEALQNNLWEQRLPIIREEKQKVLNYYNFFPTLERILFEDFDFSPYPTDEEIAEKKLLYYKTITL